MSIGLFPRGQECGPSRNRYKQKSLLRHFCEGGGGARVRGVGVGEKALYCHTPHHVSAQAL